MDKTTQTIIINTAAEPGVVFGVGNAAATWHSPEAFTVNVATTLICGGVRAATEMRNAGYNISLPPKLDTFIKNPGAAVGVGGTLTLVSSGFSIWTQPEAITPAAVMACFGVNGLCLGTALQLDKGTTKRKMVEAAGAIATSAGLSIAAQDAPLEVKLVFGLSGLMGVCMAAFNKKAEGALQPYLTNAAGSALSAVNSTSTQFKIANAVWVAGYTSLNALMKHGGLAQSIHKAKARLFGAPEHNI